MTCFTLFFCDTRGFFVGFLESSYLPVRRLHAIGVPHSFPLALCSSFLITLRGILTSAVSCVLCRYGLVSPLLLVFRIAGLRSKDPPLSCTLSFDTLP